METLQIQTERMILRLDTPETIKHAFDNLSLQEQLDYFGLTADNYQVQRDKYELSLRRQVPLHVFYLLDKDSGKTIGACGYWRYAPEHARGEIGYMLMEDAYKRKGLMHEAIQPVIKYGFEEMKLHRIEAITHPNNIASRRLLEKNGFTFEGVLREHYYTGSAYDDSASYSILRREYELR